MIINLVYVGIFPFEPFHAPFKVVCKIKPILGSQIFTSLSKYELPSVLSSDINLDLTPTQKEVLND